jgi:splicing factor 3B subunit 4
MSKGYGFVSYTDFEASDAAVESMNGQFLMNKPIQVQYAFKKDGKGERHGTEAERMLAAQARKNNALPVSARPPAAPMVPGQPAYPGAPPAAYQPGQFAGALAQPPPPPGFGPQQTMMPGMGRPPMGMQMMGPPMSMPGMPPMMGQPGMPGMPGMGMQPMMGQPGMMPGMMPPMGMPPPPPNMGVYNPGAGYPPPPPGFGQPGMQGMQGMVQPPPMQFR